MDVTNYNQKIMAEAALLDPGIAEARATLTKLEDARQAVIARTSIKCPVCAGTFAIRDVTYIQTRWYVPPRGCTGGDYWTDGEGQCACPNCDTRIRLYDKPEFVALKHLFKSIENENDRS